MAPLPIRFLPPVQVLVGKKTPTALYAWDMWLGPPQKQGHAGCHPLSPLSALNPPAAVVKTSSVKEVSVAREFVCVCVHACLNLFCRSAAAACLACPWMVPPGGRPQGQLARGRQDPGLPQGLPRPKEFLGIGWFDHFVNILRDIEEYLLIEHTAAKFG